MNQVIIQGVGFVALLFVIVSFQKKERGSLLFTMLVGLVLFVVHYLLLNAWTGALLNLVEAGVVYVSYKKESTSWARQKFWLYIFVLLFVVSGLVVSRTLIDLLPVIAQIIGVIGVWRNDPREIRFIMLVPRPLWFLYNLSIGSYAGMATEVFIFLSLVIGIFRFDIFGRSKK